VSGKSHLCATVACRANCGQKLPKSQLTYVNAPRAEHQRYDWRQPPTAYNNALVLPVGEQQWVFTGALAKIGRELENVTIKDDVIPAATIGNDAHPDDDSEVDDAFEVKKILDRRGKGKNTEYKVRWAGYSAEDDTWEPIETLADSQALVSAYDEAIHEEGRLGSEVGVVAVAAIQIAKPGSTVTTCWAWAIAHVRDR
jgi:hypothetical protein